MYCPSTAKVGIKPNKPGVHCIGLARTESKASSSGGDTCATDRSFWVLSFSGAGYSGQIRSQWESRFGGSSEIKLLDETYHKSLCNVPAFCSEYKFKWNNYTPDLYVRIQDSSMELTLQFIYDLGGGKQVSMNDVPDDLPVYYYDAQGAEIQKEAKIALELKL